MTLSLDNVDIFYSDIFKHAHCFSPVQLHLNCWRQSVQEKLNQVQVYLLLIVRTDPDLIVWVSRAWSYNQARQ